MKWSTKRDSILLFAKAGGLWSEVCWCHHSCTTVINEDRTVLEEETKKMLDDLVKSSIMPEGIFVLISNLTIKVVAFKRKN